MKKYNKVFNNPYPGGYKNLPDKTTPELAEYLNNKSASFEEIENELETLTSDKETEGSILNEIEKVKVVANPAAAQNEETLNRLKIEGKTYKVPEGGSGGAVNSVNGKTGNVLLSAADVHALPDDTELFSGDYNDLENRPEIPSELRELTEDESHQTVTKEEKDKWNQGGGTTVVANPEMSGEEENLEGIQIGSEKFKIPQGGAGSSEAKDITMNPTSIIPTTDLQSAIDYMSGVSPFNFEGTVEQKQYTICENPAFEVIFTNAINVNALSKCRMNGRTYRGVPYKEQIFWKYIYDSCDYTIEQLDDNDNVVATYRVQYFPQNDHLMKVTVLDAKTPFVISEEGKHLASANPEIEGTEEELTSIQIGSEKFKIPSGGSSDAHDITYRGTTVEAALDNVGESQGRNKMPFPYKMGMKYVDSGITFDVNNDGTIKVTGTVSNYTTFDFVKKRGEYELLPGTYNIRGGISNDIYIRVQNVTTSTDVTIATDTGNGATFTLTEKSKIYIYLQIKNNITVDETIYPMLELGQISHGFEPPAESNMAIKNELDHVFSDEWTQRTYEAGEYAVDGNRVWKCLVTNSERPKEGANWHAVKIMEEIGAVKEEVTALNSKLPLSFTPAEGVTVTAFEGFVKNGIAYAWIRINSGANSTTMGTFSVKSLGSTKYYYQGGSNVTAQQGASIRVINGDLQALIGTGTSYSPFKGDLWAFVTYPIN